MIYSNKHKESVSNYEIPSERMAFLKRRCKKYLVWKELIDGVDSDIYPSASMIQSDKNRACNDPTANKAVLYVDGEKLIFAIEESAKEASEELWGCIILKACYGRPWSIMAKEGYLKCTRDEFFDAYRRFFYILNSRL